MLDPDMYPRDVIQQAVLVIDCDNQQRFEFPLEYRSILALYLEAIVVHATAANCHQTAIAARRLIRIYMVRADGRLSRCGVGLIPCAAEVFGRRCRRNDAVRLPASHVNVSTGGLLMTAPGVGTTAAFSSSSPLIRLTC